MGVSVKQASCIGGEIAPTLHARADLQRYTTALSKCRNFIVLKHGGVSNRPGTRMVRKTKQPTRRSRLVPFVFSDAQTYALEVGDRYVRFHTSGGTVLDPATLEPYEVVTTFLEEELLRIRYAQSADVLTLVHGAHEAQELKRLGHTNWQLSNIVLAPDIAAPGALTWDAGNSEAPDASHPAKSWSWVVTAVSAKDESLPSPSLNRSTSLYPDMPKRITWAAVGGALTYNVYRGRNGVFGYVGSTATPAFNDDGQTPVYSEAPPQSRNPFNAAGKYPRTVTFHDGRRWFGGTDLEPETLQSSQVGAYRNFDRSSPAKDDDAVEFTLAARQVAEIRGLVSARVLLVLTASAEYAVTGGQNGPITPSSIEARPHGHRGSAWVDPLVVGNVALFVQSKAAGIRDLFYSYEDDGYASNDLTVLASHLFEGHELVDWAYAAEPNSVIWCVRDDGILLGLTYLREHEVWAWHWHDTEGAVESVCVVPEGREDALYLIVRRTVNGVEERFVERMASRHVEDVREGLFLDCALSYDGRNAGSTTVRLRAAEWDEDDSAQAEAIADTFDLSMVGQDLVLEHGGTEYRARFTYVTDPRTATVRLQNAIPDELRELWTSSWSIARNRFAGLEHLEGRTVGILADGMTHPTRVVAGGVIELDRRFAVVHVGLPYTPELQTLPLQFDGLSRDRKKLIPKVSLEVHQSRGLEVGQSLSRLSAWKQRRVADGYGPIPLATDLVEVQTSGKWATNGQVALRQTDPLPLTVLSIIPEVEAGG